tara:strand:+ start:979 stop:1446 length:468 start_codon:yes stop_codon:yes gene_type:complete
MTTDKKRKFRIAYDKYNRVPFKTIGESLTQQSYSQDAKIQNIIKKYDSTGFFDLVNRNPAQYGDFTQVTDLSEAMNKINEAKENFMTVPAKIRERFNNDPRQFYDFASQESNFDELVDMGLATERVAYEAPEKVSSPVVEEKAVSTPPSEGGETA